MILVKEREVSEDSIKLEHQDLKPRNIAGSGLYLGKYLTDGKGNLYVPDEHVSLKSYYRGRFRPIDLNMGNLVSYGMQDLTDRNSK